MICPFLVIFQRPVLQRLFLPRCAYDCRLRLQGGRRACYPCSHRQLHPGSRGLHRLPHNSHKKKKNMLAKTNNNNNKKKTRNECHVILWKFRIGQESKSWKVWGASRDVISAVPFSGREPRTSERTNRTQKLKLSTRKAAQGCAQDPTGWTFCTTISQNKHKNQRKA